MTDLRTAAQRLLEAIDRALPEAPLCSAFDVVADTADDLRKALAQPEVEPCNKSCAPGYCYCEPIIKPEIKVDNAEPVAYACFKNGELQTELIGTEADVDFWCASDEPEMQGMGKGALYTAPPRQWQTLSDEEIAELALQEQLLLICDDLESLTQIVRAAEVVLRAKNSTLACIPAVPPG